MFPLDPIWPFYMEKIDQKRAKKGSPSLIHNKKQCPDARSDLDQLQTYLDLGGGAKPSPMAPGNFRSVHWFIGFFGIFRDLYILIRRGEGAPPGTFFSSTLPLTILPKHGGTTRFWVRNAKITTFAPENAIQG